MQELSLELLNEMSIEEFKRFLKKGVRLSPTKVKKLEKEKKLLYHQADHNPVWMGLGVWGIDEKKLRKLQSQTQLTRK